MLYAMLTLLFTLILTWFASVSPAPINDVCTGSTLQPRPPDFAPQGIILSAWNREAMWAYDVARNARYPIDNTAPCGTNCHLSPDALSITYRDIAAGAFGAMWLNGANRRVFIRDATEVQWWSDDRLLVWSERNRPFLFDLRDESREPFAVNGLVNVQPGGYWGMTITLDDDGLFARRLVDGRGDGNGVDLGLDEAYFSAAAWSPDGAYMAFIDRAEHDAAFRRGAEVYLIAPEDTAPTRATYFTEAYGAVRIGGLAPGGLSWSPDSRRIAFWVIPRTGPDITADLEPALLHILHIDSGGIDVYCDYATTDHTPNPPRLVWSPDGSKVAFAGENTARGSGTALIALDVESGNFYTLSLDVVAALGRPDVIAWGRSP